MRRYSLVLAFALAVIFAVVGYTLKLRLDKARAQHVNATPAMKTGMEGLAPSGWQYKKDDPQTNKPVVRVDAEAFEGTHDPSTFELKKVRLRLYDKKGASYTFVQSDRALFDEGSGVLKSKGPVYIVINVPVNKDAEDPKEAARRVRVRTTGVTYETRSGKAQTADAASFIFTEGDGRAVGAEYDPNTKVLHLKSNVALDWIGKGPVQRKMHIETHDLVYKEAEGKILLSPWSRMTRQSTRIDARNTLITLAEQHLHQIEGDHGKGNDGREGRRTNYSADKMTAVFDEGGNLVQIVGDRNAQVESLQPNARTKLSGARADLRFALEARGSVTESQLHLVMADGHSVAESMPLPRPGANLAETRILKSEHIELEMKPGGKELQEIRTSTAAQLEFKPNRLEQAHRTVNASHLRVLYGAGSYVDRLLAWDAATQTEKPAVLAKLKTGKDGKPIPLPPALTWSDLMTVQFEQNSNQVGTIDQSGNFRYEEGERKAWAKRAYLEQAINRITLTGLARVLDSTGSAAGEKIVMNQANGNMDASGHVLSTHEPDRHEQPGTSMLDATEPMQAQSDSMQTREDNTKVFYEGHVVMWQGANRISADHIVIDRDDQSLDAVGKVVSELVDSKGGGLDTKATGTNGGPTYTMVQAPKLVYRDDVRVAHYTEGVKLVRGRMTITSKELQAYLKPKTDKTADQSSLDHAVANGNVSISDVVSPGRTRTGTGEHAEYYATDDKVILNGGAPQMVDNLKGVIHGQQLTYFSGADHLIVDGKKSQQAFTRMKKKTAKTTPAAPAGRTSVTLGTPGP